MLFFWTINNNFIVGEIVNDIVEKNKEYIMTINSQGYEGEGVGKVNGFTVFVPGAIINEKVRVKIIKVNKNFAFGKLMDIIETSKYRKDPSCNIYKRCGGCQLQHMSYEYQLDFKKNRVKDCLERIGKLQVEENEDLDNKSGKVKLYDTIGMEKPYRYRNKVQLPVGKSKNGVAMGFYARRSHQIIDADSCYIQNETADEIIKIVRQWINKYDIDIYDEKNKVGTLRHIMIRKAFSTGEVMLVIVTSSSKLPFKSELIKSVVENVNGVKSIIQNINNKNTNVILGQKCITLWGSGTINDYIGKFKFNIAPLSFFQVNPVQTEILYKKVMEYADLTGNEIVFDAYCGTGTISLFLSQSAKKVYGVEVIAQAIENAKVNAMENGVDNTEFIVGKSEVVIPELIDKGIKADVVVVDPPRKGCDKELLISIAKMAPSKIIYVSCDPGTLARDLNILEELGYKTECVQPVDMFSQTAHVECVVKLKRKDS